MIKNVFRVYAAATLVVLSFAANSFVQAASTSDFSNISIKNFGQMDDRFYRGAQPKPDEYKELKDLGVNTVIDLREDPTSYEKSAVESLGMRYINIPMKDTSYPKAENIDAFLKLANDPDTGVFFVHCKGGKHRTGVMGAAYRFTKYGWDYDQVYNEMLKFDFYTSWGHGPMKDFVVDYAKKMKEARAQTAVNQTQTGN